MPEKEEKGLQRRERQSEPPVTLDRVIPKSDEIYDISDFELSELVVGLYLEKNNSSEILRELCKIDEKYATLNHSHIGSIIKQYESSVTKFVTDNPDLLDRKLDLVVRNIESYDRVERALWNTYKAATDSKGQSMALANIHKIVSEKSKLQQLLDSDKQLQKELKDAKEANHKLVLLVNEITNGCPQCRERLNQHFANSIRVTSI